MSGGYELRVLPVTAVRPADYNPRVALRPGDPDYEKLRASITDLGVIDPLVWNENTGNLVGGHQRLQVCMDMGITEVPVFVVHLSEEKEKQANLALNKITGRFDETKLNEILTGLDPAVIKLAGFDPKELTKELLIRYKILVKELTGKTEGRKYLRLAIRDTADNDRLLENSVLPGDVNGVSSAGTQAPDFPVAP